MSESLWEMLANRWISVQSIEDKKAIESFVNSISSKADSFSGAKSIVEELLIDSSEDESDASQFK